MKAADTIGHASAAQRQCVTRRDLTDCLLEAYDFVARRAYEKFVERGGQAGQEMEDWLSAEHELLGRVPVDLCEGEEYVSAIASLPGFSGEDVEVGIEARWLVIIGCRSGDEEWADKPISTETKAETRRRDAAGSAARSRTTSHAVTKAPAKRMRDRALEKKLRDVALEAAAEFGDPNPSEIFTLIELPAEVDPERSVAVLSDGLLGIRMPKAKPRELISAGSLMAG
ncbi:MAG: DUF2934 domain-containing protein [Candidatus Acidiferrales bacterium]